jgi:hypothetical protein
MTLRARAPVPARAATDGRSGPTDLLRTDDLLPVRREAGNGWTQRLIPPQLAAAAVFNDAVASNCS